MAALQAFPSLTEHEFTEACMAFEARSADKLDNTDWLSVHWTGNELLVKQTRRSQNSKGEDADNAKKEEPEDETANQRSQMVRRETIKLIRTFKVCLQRANRGGKAKGENLSIANFDIYIKSLK